MLNANTPETTLSALDLEAFIDKSYQPASITKFQAATIKEAINMMVDDLKEVSDSLEFNPNGFDEEMLKSGRELKAELIESINHLETFFYNVEQTE
jgi:hypothetical protein